MVHGKNRIPYWIDRRLSGLVGPDYDATISFGLPIEPGDCPYGKYRLIHQLHSLTYLHPTTTPYPAHHPTQTHSHLIGKPKGRL